VSDIRVLNSKGEIVAKETVPKRYTFLLGKGEKTRTASERLLSIAGKTLSLEDIRVAFSVEKMSKSFFDEYKAHYEKFCDYLQDSNYRTSVFRISIDFDATKKEKDKACKPIRDFTKKLLGRIVFLYFVQKKGWLGASSTEYKDGSTEFIRELFISSGADGSFYPAWLSILFFDTLNKGREKDDFTMPDGRILKIPYLNGGLFDKEKYENDLITLPSILFHNPANSEDPKQRSFLDFLDSYNFTIYEDSPEEHTVAVDPEMLSHIFENLLEDNKDKGAFYTPKEIVHYMCQESLIEYLTTHLSKEFTVYRQIGSDQIEFFGNETKTGQLTLVEEIGEKALNRNDVENIVRNKDFKDLTEKQLKRIDELLDSVKICDPAIGSGAFPMGLLKEIFGIKELIAYMTDADWNPSQVKLNIIQNSIYGVDIEKGAVDIARLRFWLSLIVDEEYPKPLPNLDYKIVVGDSLISKFENEIIEIDWNRKSNVGKADEYIKNVQKYLKEVATKQREYFNPKNKNKKMLHSEIRNLKIELLINQVQFNKEYFISNNEIKGGFMPSASDHKHNLEIELQIANYNNLVKKLENLKNNQNAPFNHFDWKLDFPEILNPYLVPDENQMGFDIVIANPPYYLAEDEIQKKILKGKYKTLHFKINLFACFIEQGYILTKNNGYFSYIIPNLFFANDSLKLSREMILNNTSPVFFMNLGDNIFENATVPTMIFGIKKNSIKNNYFKIIPHATEIKDLEKKYFISTNEQIKNNFNYVIETSNPVASNIIKKIEKESEYLEKYLDINQGIITGNDKVLLSHETIDKSWKQTIRGKDIEKYRTDYPVLYVNYSKGMLACPRSDELFDVEEKLLLRRTGDYPIASYDNNRSYNLHTLYSCRNKSHHNIKFFLALLNSNLIKFIYQQKMGTEIGRTFAEIKILYLRKLPVTNNIVDTDKFVRLVDYIIFSKSYKQTKMNNIINLFFVQIIDVMVYELYFPELIKSHNCEIIKHLGGLPELTESMNDEEKMEIVKDVFNRLNAKDHPVRNNLEKMKNEIKEIKIVEGDKEEV